MGKPGKDGLLKHRKSLELALRESKSGKVKGTSGRMFRALAEMGGPACDITEDRVASIERRIAEIDDQIKRGDHA